ncbi:serine hydrolase domain-containing protein [Sphingomonas quercus]|uniref:Beta-lactamase family protein n=1 Tax=Sphingomonas quercus TaxID=2842451 RepID=A0ABS6BKX7_9SPHN|nr:beta-lactamase family protein [Sphingomonas quercus]
MIRPPKRPRRARPGFVAILVAAGVIALLAAAMSMDLFTRRIGPTKLAPALTADASGAIVEAPPVGSRIDYRRLDQRLTRLAGMKGVVGFAVAVVEQGRIRFLKGYGVRAPGSTDPVDLKTRFAWASLSKTVAATLMERLAQEGRVRLDRPVADYGTSLRLPNGGEQVVTVEDVLSHRTGLVKNAWDDRLEDGQDPAVIRGDYAKLSNLCRPGTCFAYQNIAYDTAHEIVEKVTGTPYAQAVRQLIFGPLGMTGASIGQEGLEADDDWARPSNGLRAYPVQQNYYHVPAAGGVNSTIVDLGIWLRAQMGGVPAILPPALLDDLHRARVDTWSEHRTEYDVPMRDTSYALGFRNAWYDGRRLIGHRGAVRGYRSLISFDPEAGVGVAVLWNSESTRPVGIPMEIWDMLAGRPAKDWLRLDDRKKAS